MPFLSEAVACLRDTELGSDEEGAFPWLTALTWMDADGKRLKSGEGSAGDGGTTGAGGSGMWGRARRTLQLQGLRCPHGLTGGECSGSGETSGERPAAKSTEA